LNKINAIFLFFILSMSLFSIANPYSFATSDNSILNDDSKVIPEINNHYEISFSESLSISTDDETLEQSPITQNHQPQIVTHKKISFSEKISMNLNVIGDDVINFVKEQLDRKTILERIFEKTKPIRINSNLDKQVISLDYVNDDSEINFNYLDLNSMQNFLEITNQEQQILWNSLLSFENNDEHSIFSTETPIILVLALPVIGYILLRSEKEKIEFYEIRKLSSIFILIVMSSTILLTPLTVSSSYWGMAYAEEFSFNGIIDDYENSIISNVTTVESITEPILNATTTEPILNATTTHN